MGDETRKVLDKIEPDRRRFVQRILAIAGFAVPSVRSYLLAAPQATMLTTLPTPTQTAVAQTMTTQSQTTAAPGSTTAAPTDPFFLQWFSNADGK
jgi:hypothetical protein